MRLMNRAGLSDQELGHLRHEIAALTTLERVVRWGFSKLPPVDVADIVVQDEFTHDVVVPWEARYLVFDTT